MRLIHSSLSERIIRSAIAEHRERGAGHLEKLYEDIKKHQKVCQLVSSQKRGNAEEIVESSTTPNQLQKNPRGANPSGRE